MCSSFIANLCAGSESNQLVAKKMQVAETLFYAPLDGSPDALSSVGDKSARVQGSIQYVDGAKGKAAVVGGGGRIIFNAENNFNVGQGTCSFWVSPQNWEAKTKNFVFFVSFTDLNNRSSRGGETADILVYKYSASTTLKILARKNDKHQATIDKDISFWQINEWHQIVLTWNNAELTLYIDGTKIQSVSQGQATENIKEIILGIPYSSWACLGDEKTAIDELMIFSD